MNKEVADKIISAINAAVSEVICDSDIPGIEQLDLYNKIKIIVYGEVT